MWLVANNTILTNVERRRRHLATEANCPRCNHQEESTLHVLRDCSYAKCVWSLLNPHEIVADFFNLSIKDWLAQNLSARSDWACKFGVTVSSLWFYRNSLIFEGNRVRPTVVARAIRARSEEILGTMKFRSSMQRTRKDNNQLIRWILPPEHCTKLNVDGSFFRENNNAACGGIFRNHLGRYMLGFSCNLGSCSITHAELWDIVKGLQIAIAQNFQHIIIESDSWSAINFIKEGCSTSDPVKPLLEDINILSSRLQHVVWNHTLREANAVADSFAKKGQNLHLGIHLFDRPLPDTLQALATDINGSFRVRGF
ncbi:putative ribonuclease H protein At1g65750 isoform X2 [Arachis hypogaea]